MEAKVGRVLLWGGRSQARIIEAQIVASGLASSIVVFDPTLEQCAYPSTAPFYSDPRTLRTLLPAVSHFVVCIGGTHGLARVRISDALRQRGLTPLEVVHPTAFIDRTCLAREGLQVMPGAIVNVSSRLGPYVILGTNSTVEHETVLGSGVHIYPGATVAGLTEIHDYATIGLGSVVLPRLVIGEGAVVQPGSVVHDSIPPYTSVGGNPAVAIDEVARTFDEGALAMIHGSN